MKNEAKTGPSRNVQRHELWLDAKDEINKGVARFEPRQGKGLEAKH